MYIHSSNDMRVRSSDIFFPFLLILITLLVVSSTTKGQSKKIRGTWDLHKMIQQGDTVYDASRFDMDALIHEHLEAIRGNRKNVPFSRQDSIQIVDNIRKRVERFQDLSIEFGKDSIYYSKPYLSDNEEKTRSGKYWLNRSSDILYMHEDSKLVITIWNIELKKKSLTMEHTTEKITFVMKKR